MHIEICVVFQAKIVGQRSTAISDIIFGIWYKGQAILGEQWKILLNAVDSPL
jgi:hypothetical protein